MTREYPILWKTKQECSGCSACFAVCNENAIEMIEDELGFQYPAIIREKCIQCLACIKVCPLKKGE